MGYKTKIDWCDATWNPVIGCLHGCEYCYARRIAERFGGVTPSEYGKTQVLDSPGLTTAGKPTPYPFGFLPTFHRYKLGELLKWKKPRTITIFVCSMADLFGDWVPDEWIQQVFKACDVALQHRYLFLTKNPGRYRQIADLMPDWEDMYIDHSRAEMLFGATATDDAMMQKAYESDAEWVSIEPILQPIAPEWFTIYENYYGGGMYKTGRWRWVIISAETGNSKNKIIPQKEWVQGIADVCRAYGTPVFMEESLRKLMGDDFRQEFPWQEEP